MSDDAASLEIRACCTLDTHRVHLPHGQRVDEAISMNGKLWHPGDTIRFGFLDGSPTQRTKTQKWIEYWLQVANLHFQFNAPNPDVRITFTPGGSWSYLGTDCRNQPIGPTFQLGWVTDSSDDESDRAVIVHEAGHMLGLGHEQSSPLEDIAWNKPAAFAYYGQAQGWTADMVESNVFHVFGASEVTGTAYDRTSIMQYPVPDQLTTDGRGIAWNTDLSPLDRTYVSIIYPGTATPTPAPTPTPTEVITPVVQIDELAAHHPIPAPGQPARFALGVPGDCILHLTAAIQPAMGRFPILFTQWGAQPPVRIGLQQGRGTVHFAAGNYMMLMFNAMPRMTGEAWLKIKRA